MMHMMNAAIACVDFFPTLRMLLISTPALWLCADICSVGPRGAQHWHCVPSCPVGMQPSPPRN